MSRAKSRKISKYKKSPQNKGSHPSSQDSSLPKDFPVQEPED